MANTTLTADIIAKAAAPLLENQLGWIADLYRAPEEEFSGSVNGYKKGDTVSSVVRQISQFAVAT